MGFEYGYRKSNGWKIRELNVGYNDIPSGKLTELSKITIFNKKTHYKWQCSIAMLNYQRVTVYLGFADSIYRN